LKLEVGQLVDFQDINYISKDGYAHRKGKWKVNVISTDTAWRLSVGGSDLTLEGDPTQKIGPMVYRDKMNNDFPLITGTPDIAQDDGTNHETDISNMWSDDDGILLQNKSLSPAGKYHGEITWKLIESV